MQVMTLSRVRKRISDHMLAVLSRIFEYLLVLAARHPYELVKCFKETVDAKKHCKKIVFENVSLDESL